MQLGVEASEANMETEAKSGSSFIRELEDRLNVIFSEDEKPRREEPPRLAGMPELESVSVVSVVPGEEGRGELFSDLNESRSIMFSQINELKTIVLSLEWEINESILVKFDEEVMRLEGIYSEDTYALAFARILRFLGRYIRRKRAESEPRSINLLLSTYDNLENVLLSRAMPESEKYSLMRDNIERYRHWVEGVNLIPGEEGQSPAAERPALKVLVSKTGEETPPPEGPESAIEVSAVDEGASTVFQDEIVADRRERAAATDIEATDNARIFEDEPAHAKVPAFAGPGVIDEIRADYIEPGQTRADGVFVNESGDASAVPDEVNANEPSGRGDALASDLERMRLEIRKEIMQEVRAEIDALRDEIRSLAARGWYSDWSYK